MLPPESHVAESFYDLYLRKLLLGKISDNTVKSVHLYFSTIGGERTKEENQTLKSKLKILHRFLVNKDTSLKEINEELKKLDDLDKIYVIKFFDDKDLRQLSQSFLGY